ncbi:MAG: radical SAM protein [Fibromonadaceae bacterium]|jgi:sulfatase maturation enzyme AslB (radical SAM superfamily)|nr:radical SAM protein [Fibromonadaceae bacterium]
MFCPRIGTYLFIDKNSLSICCEPNRTTIKHTANIEDSIKAYYDLCETLNYKLSVGEKTRCDGCAILKEGVGTPTLKIDLVRFGSGLRGATRCNFLCNYCVYGEHNGKINGIDMSILDVLNFMETHLMITKIDYYGGELLVSEDRDKIINIFRRNDWSIRIGTNCSIFSENLFDLIKQKKTMLEVSLDAGTELTFSKLKGVNLFEKVKRNLLRYASASNGSMIHLKYILFDRINDDDKNINGFIDIISKVNPGKVVIAHDVRSRMILSDREKNDINLLVLKCQKERIPISVQTNGFNNSDLPFLKELELY